MASPRPKRDIYQEVTDKILDYLDSGALPPWRQPIRGGAGGGGFPKSLATGKPYRGLNVFLLAITSWLKGYSSDYWLTFNQAKKLGGSVRKGEESTLVVFWKLYAKRDQETGKEQRLPVLRHYRLFSADQVEGIVPPDAHTEEDPAEFEPLEAAERIVAGFTDPPTIEHAGHAACYYPSTDKVRIAPPERFVPPEAYYATLFHEFAHATGHPRRLNRERGPDAHQFGSPDYSREELVAEFGGAFLCAAAGISPPTIEQSAAYIAGWRKRLGEEKKLLVQAAGQGQRAADCVLGVTFAGEACAPTDP